MNSVRRIGDEEKANRRIFFDFTIAPPKSVSVVGLVQDVRVLELHDRAVRLALVELEKRAESRVRKSGKNGERTTGNLVTACFRHETSRELDPHLHTHCVVMNARSMKWKIRGRRCIGLRCIMRISLLLIFIVTSYAMDFVVWAMKSRIVDDGDQKGVASRLLTNVSLRATRRSKLSRVVTCPFTLGPR